MRRRKGHAALVEFTRKIIKFNFQSAECHGDAYKKQTHNRFHVSSICMQQFFTLTGGRL